MIAVVSFLLAWGATRLLDWGVEDKGTRDAGIVGVAILTIIGFYVALVFSPWVRGQPQSHPADPQQGEPAAAGFDRTAALVASIATEADVTGETKVHELVGEYLQAGALRAGAMSGETIDYYPPPAREGDWQDIRSFANLRLGEVALIRRLGVAPYGVAPPRRCAAVLHASGITHPESSITTLEDLGLVTVDEDLIQLTERGRRFIYLSNQAFVHEAHLVSAYRQVTPNINRAVRFDGRGLSR